MSNSSPFWSAYSSAVKNFLLPGVIPPKDNEVFVLPFTLPFTDATSPLTDEGYNYLVYSLANTTLAADGSSKNYATELSTYLNTVDQSSLQDPQAKQKLDEAEKNLQDAQEAFDQATADAMAEYDDVPPPKPPFEQWVVQNWPPYLAAKRFRDSAKTQRDQAYNAYWGRIKTLQGYLDNIKKALDTQVLYRSYNMPVRQDGGDSTFAPHYSSVGFKDQLNNWIQGGGQEQTFVEVKVDSATPPGTTPSQGIYLRLTTKGFGKFDIHVGSWNVDGVKTLYPKRNSGAPDVLNPKYARPISFLVAYDPKLEVVIQEDGDQTTNSTNSTVMADNKPYAVILGVLGQHFPAN